MWQDQRDRDTRAEFAHLVFLCVVAGGNAILGISTFILAPSSEAAKRVPAHCTTYITYHAVDSTKPVRTTVLKDDVGGLLETPGLEVWMWLHVISGVAQGFMVAILLLLFFCCCKHGRSEGALLCLFGIGIGIATTFRFCWIIVGCCLVFRNCDSQIYPENLQTVVLITLYWGIFVEILPVVVDAGAYGGYTLYRKRFPLEVKKPGGSAQETRKNSISLPQEKNQLTALPRTSFSAGGPAAQFALQEERSVAADLKEKLREQHKQKQTQRKGEKGEAAQEAHDGKMGRVVPRPGESGEEVANSYSHPSEKYLVLDEGGTLPGGM